MFEFFIALFGGAYWAGKIGADKRKSKQADVRIKSEAQMVHDRRAAWEEKVLDRQLEAELRRRLKEYDEELVNEVESVRAELSPEKKFLPMDDNGIAILMAKRGKLPDSYSVLGFSTYANSQYSDVSRRFAIWLNSQLEQHGIIEDMYVQTAHDLAFPFEDGTSRCGRYVWPAGSIVQMRLLDGTPV